MIAVRTPEYLPRLGFFALMRSVDRFVLADTRRYSRQSYENRTRLRTPDGWQWVSVPLRGGQHGRAVLEVQIDRSKNWRDKHLRSLAYNYRSSPYFEYYEERVTELLAQDWVHLGALTVASVRLLQPLLAPGCRLLVASELEGMPRLTAEMVDRAGDDTLVVLAEGERSEAGKVEQVLRFDAEPYRQVFAGFEPGMSALDLLFNYGPSAAEKIDEWTSRP